MSSYAHLGQIAAIATLRWRVFVNSLRTTWGQMELVSRFIVALALATGGFGGAIGMGVGAYFMLSAGHPELLALLFWFVFVFWQLFPIMATAFANNPDSSDLLRFPLSYRTYFLVRLAYGAFDPATAQGILWSLGVLVGVGFAKPAVLPWALLVVLAFVAFNLVLMQMLFAWVERWLARRRSREIMGIFFVLLMLSFQLIGPLLQHFEKRSRPEVHRFISLLAPVQGIFPPGLAGDAITQAIYPQFGPAITSLALISAYVLLVGYALHARLRAQYRGEVLSEVAAASALPKNRWLRLGWNLPGIPTPVTAVFEKEIRYFLRSGPMLLNLIMPLFVLLIFRLGPMNAARHSGAFLARASNLAFPAAAGYGLLMLTNLVCNCFGGDGGGIQFFFASPVHFRAIVLGKNLTHGAILAVETLLAWIAVGYLYGRPAFDVTMATLAGLFFAAPLNFSVGDLLSIYSPRRLDYSAFRRQNPSQMSVLVSLGIQLFVLFAAALAFWLGRHYGNLWIATLILLILAAISLSIYRMILNRMDSLVLKRRETLVAELCRA